VLDMKPLYHDFVLCCFILCLRAESSTQKLVRRK
jgi:hypothetical protein